MVYSGGPGSGAKEAITRYKVLARSGEYALVRVALDTGRKNQIRVSHVRPGLPRGRGQKVRRRLRPMDRLALHAVRLTITDPRTGAPLTVTAPVPGPFLRLFPGAEKWVQQA